LIYFRFLLSRKASNSRTNC